MKQILSNFDSSPLTCDPALFPGKNSPNIAKSNHIFPGKKRGNKTFILTYLYSPTADVFLHQSYLFRIQLSSGRNVGPITLTFGLSLFHKNSNPSKNLQRNFWFARKLPLVRISVILDYMWGSKGPNTYQKGPLDAESVRKMWKIFNLTNTNALLMKLSTIIYLHESVNRKTLRTINSVFWINRKFGFLGNLDCIKNRHICHAIPSIASPLKLFYKLDDI